MQLSNSVDGEVVDQKLILTNTGDGLSKAMAVAPIVIRHGETVDLLIRARAHKVRFDPVKDDDSLLTRVEILAAETITIVDRDFAEGRIAAQEAANDAAAARAKIPFDKDVAVADDWEDPPADGVPVVDGDPGEWVACTLRVLSGKVAVCSEADWLQRAVWAEQAGKGRASAVALLEARIDELEAGS